MLETIPVCGVGHLPLSHVIEAQSTKSALAGVRVDDDPFDRHEGLTSLQIHWIHPPHKALLHGHL